MADKTKQWQHTWLVTDLTIANQHFSIVILHSEGSIDSADHCSIWFNEKTTIDDCQSNESGRARSKDSAWLLFLPPPCTHFLLSCWLDWSVGRSVSTNADGTSATAIAARKRFRLPPCCTNENRENEGMEKRKKGKNKTKSYRKLEKRKERNLDRDRNRDRD